MVAANSNQGRAVQVQEDTQVLMCRAAQLTAYAQQHLSTPARQQAPSTAHRERAPVKERSFLLLEQEHVNAACADPGSTELEQHLLIRDLPSGIRTWHQMLFSCSRTAWHALYRPAACACSACLRGASGCSAPNKVPPWQELQLFQVDQLEWEVWQLMKQQQIHLADGFGRVQVCDLSRFLTLAKSNSSSRQVQRVNSSKEAMLMEAKRLLLERRHQQQQRQRELLGQASTSRAQRAARRGQAQA